MRAPGQDHGGLGLLAGVEGAGRDSSQLVIWRALGMAGAGGAAGSWRDGRR